MGNLKRVSSYIMYLSDLLAFVTAFLIAYAIRRMLPGRYAMPDITRYMPLLYATLLSYVLVMAILISNDNYILRRGRAEFWAVLKMIVLVMLTDVVFLFFTKTSASYSRVYFAVFLVVAYVVDCAFRIFMKTSILPKYRNSRGAERIILVTESNRVEEFRKKLTETRDWRFQVSGIVLMDDPEGNCRIPGIPVLPQHGDVLQTLCMSETDSVMLATDRIRNRKRWTEQLRNFGKTIYINLDDFNLTDSTRMFDYLGDCAVVSYLAPMPVRGKPLAIKRGLDILFSLFFLPLLLAVYLLVAAADLLFSRGPVLLPAERIGKRGKWFRQYRFRILRMDAKERIRAGKSPYSPVGRVVRFLHIDGLPQIYNLLVGDMSLVGPRACSPQEFQEYNPKIVRNLCTRPGMIGLWSLHKYGENGIFDQNRYIHHWNLRLDLKIVILFLFRVLTFRYKRQEAIDRIEEECLFIQETLSFREPMQLSGSRPENRKAGEGIYLAGKRLVDILGSLTALLLLSPVFLLLMILIIADDGGNPFYGHSRIGKDGKRIKVYKFRSMKQDVGNIEDLLTPEQLEQYRKEFKIDNDPRITAFGSFLRKSSLDELPQLLNILKGELSIIGPRPITEEEVLIYGEDAARLLSVRPGLTGYWQAYARNNATYETGERQKMEMYYVDNHGILLDIRILFRTVIAVFKQEGAQ